MENKQQRFPIFSRLLHWLMAIMVLAMLFIGAGMVTSLGDYHLMLTIHKPLGAAIFALVILRIINRRLTPPPQLPAHMPQWQKLAARGSHVLLYTLMFLLPLIGWAMLSAGGYPIQLSDTLHLFPIAPHSAMLYAMLRKLHTYLAYLLFLTILAHLGAALMHALIFRDGVFESMASWKIRRNKA